MSYQQQPPMGYPPMQTPPIVHQQQAPPQYSQGGQETMVMVPQPQQGQQYPPGTRTIPQNSQKWSAGLCDCSPCESCLLGTFLPCLLIGKTSERFRDPSLQTYEAINSDCLVFSAIHCFTGCGWIYVMLKRTEIRERFGIAGSGCGDCCTAYWCPCCSLIQQDNEVKNRLSAVASGHVQVGYQSQPPMKMPGQ